MAFVMVTEALVPSEETLVIETPERVPLHFALASIGNRFLACTVDHTIQIVTLFLMYMGFSFIIGATRSIEQVTDAPNWLIAVAVIVLFLISSCYFVFFEWLWNGQTPGKRWLKLRVIREDGRPITFWEASVRNLTRIFDMQPTAIPIIGFYSVGIISIFISRRDQRVGDLFAGTVVVREREAEAPTFEQVFVGPVSDSAYRRAFRPVMFMADLSALTESEIEVVEAFLRRRWDLQDMPRQWMAWRVAMPILYKLRPSYDLPTFTYEGFLEELLHRYRALHRFRD